MSARGLGLLAAGRAQGWPDLANYAGGGPGRGEAAWLTWLERATPADIQRAQNALVQFSHVRIATRETDVVAAPRLVEARTGGQMTMTPTEAVTLLDRAEALGWPNIGERAWRQAVVMPGVENLIAELDRLERQREEDARLRERHHVDRMLAGLEEPTAEELARRNQYALEERAAFERFEAERPRRIEALLSRIASALESR